MDEELFRRMVQALEGLANGVTPMSAAPGHDARDGVVGSATEGLISIANGLFAIADAIENLSEQLSSAVDGIGE